MEQQKRKKRNHQNARKVAIISLTIVTLGSIAGGVFYPAMFALSGTALAALIVVTKSAVAHRNDQDESPAESAEVSVNEAPQNLSPPKLRRHGPSPSQDRIISPTGEEEAKHHSPRPLERDFSMHISYRPNKYSPNGTNIVSPEALDVSVRTRSPTDTPLTNLRNVDPLAAPRLTTGSNPVSPAVSPVSPDRTLVRIDEPVTPPEASPTPAHISPNSPVMALSPDVYPLVAPRAPRIDPVQIPAPITATGAALILTPSPTELSTRERQEREGELMSPRHITRPPGLSRSLTTPENY